MVMSGNTMFWRVSFDETDEVMECRKFGGGIGGRKLAKIESSTIAMTSSVEA